MTFRLAMAVATLLATAGTAAGQAGGEGAAAGLAPGGGPPASVPTVRVVSPEGPWRSVGEAVQASAPHDTVRVRAGVYREPMVVVDRPLTLVGEPGAVLDGEGARGLIDVTADSVTVRGLTLRNTGITFADDRAALKVEKARFCRVEDNVVDDAFFGIYLANAGDCVVRGNVLTTSGDRETRLGNGIHLWYSVRVTVADNRIRGHRDGIYFEFVEDSRITGNVSRGNLRYGLHFMFSDGCTYRRNVFTGNGAGVAVMYTENVVMEHNDFDDNTGSAAFGLLLKDITDSRIAGNRFRRNSVALHAEGANRVEVVGNEFLENGWAVQLLANSEESEFRENNFVGNSFDVSTNSRRAYSTFRGNYWDRYRGFDRDGDGVGDLPFRPVRLFSLIVERTEPALVLQRSLLVQVLDLAEEVFPILTPDELEDERPALAPLSTPWRTS